MKNLFYLLIASLLFSNCGHRIVRTGYQIKKSDYSACEVVIKKATSISDTLATKIGEIKLGETGLSVACNEGDAINILRNEACAIKADVVLITEETRPDVWSSCYRCKAEFYKLKKPDNNTLKSDNKYTSDKVQSRVAEDRSRNTAMLIGSVVAGFVVGLLMIL